MPLSNADLRAKLDTAACDLREVARDLDHPAATDEIAAHASSIFDVAGALSATGDRLLDQEYGPLRPMSDADRAYFPNASRLAQIRDVAVTFGKGDPMPALMIIDRPDDHPRGSGRVSILMTDPEGDPIELYLIVRTPEPFTVMGLISAALGAVLDIDALGALGFRRV